MLISALLGLTLAQAGPDQANVLQPLAQPPASEPMAAYPSIPPLGRKLRSAKDLRTVGVVLSLTGPPVFVSAAFALLISALDGGMSSYDSAVGLLIVGGTAMIVGPPITMAGGYQARSIVNRHSSEGTLPGVATAAWLSHAFAMGYGVTYPASVGLSWGWANTMIDRADRALYVEAEGIDDQKHPVYISLQPTYDRKNGRLGLRIDGAF
jgi:hypothetical protein